MAPSSWWCSHRCRVVALIRLRRKKGQDKWKKNNNKCYGQQNKRKSNLFIFKGHQRDIPAGSVGDSWDLGGLPNGDPYPSGVGLSLAAMVSPALTVS